jgi:hypothetical protein
MRSDSKSDRAAEEDAIVSMQSKSTAGCTCYAYSFGVGHARILHTRCRRSSASESSVNDACAAKRAYSLKSLRRRQLNDVYMRPAYRH